MIKKQRVEIMFDVPRGEGITIELNEKDSKRLIELIKKYGDWQVFFPDYEDK